MNAFPLFRTRLDYLLKLSMDFMDNKKVRDDCFVNCGFDELIYNVIFDQNSLNTCILKPIEGQDGQHKKDSIRLIRRVKGIPIIYQV